MNRIVLVVTVAGMFMFPAAKATTDMDEDPAMDNDPISSEEQRVLAVEDEYVAAEIKRDEAALRRIVDDRFVLNSSDGTTTGKDALIEAILGWDMSGQTISERTVVVDGDTAVICGTAELRFGVSGEKESRSLLRYTSTYIKRHDQWRFLALQMAKREARQ